MESQHTVPTMAAKAELKMEAPKRGREGAGAGTELQAATAAYVTSIQDELSGMKQFQLRALMAMHELERKYEQLERKQEHVLSRLVETETKYSNLVSRLRTLEHVGKKHDHGAFDRMVETVTPYSRVASSRRRPHGTPRSIPSDDDDHADDALTSRRRLSMNDDIDDDENDHRNEHASQMKSLNSSNSSSKLKRPPRKSRRNSMNSPMTVSKPCAAPAAVVSNSATGSQSVRREDDDVREQGAAKRRRKGIEDGRQGDKDGRPKSEGAAIAHDSKGVPLKRSPLPEGMAKAEGDADGNVIRSCSPSWYASPTQPPPCMLPSPPSSSQSASPQPSSILLSPFQLSPELPSPHASKPTSKRKAKREKREKRQTAGSKKKSVFDGLRTAGDAAREVERMYEETRLKVEPGPVKRTVRNKHDRDKMVAKACPECEQFYQEAFGDDPAKLKDMIQRCGKHRAERPQGGRETPDDYWKLSFDESQTQPPPGGEQV